MGTAAAMQALAFVEPYPEQRILAEASQDGAYGADGVAPFTAPQPGAYCNDDKRDAGRNQQWCRASAYDRAHHAPVCAVRPEQRHNQLQVDDDTADESGRNRVAHPAPLLVEIEFLVQRLDLLSQRLSQPNHDILEHAQGTQHRAVDAPEQPGNQQYAQHYRGIAESEAPYEPHGGGQQLEFCQPAPPAVAYADEQQRNADEAHRRKDYSYFL